MNFSPSDQTHLPVAADRTIPAPDVLLEATLTVPLAARGIVALLHASSAGRFNRSNRFSGEVLEQSGLATLQVDLLTPEEEASFPFAAPSQADAALLLERVLAVIDWAKNQADVGQLTLGLHAATAETAAAVSAAERSPVVAALVSRCADASFGHDTMTSLRIPSLFLADRDLARAEELAAEFFGRHLV